MKRIKNSVKALIISACVLVVAVATVITVVLVNRKKENPAQPSQKYVLTAAQKDLVSAINAKNLEEFKNSKNTFTVGDDPLFVDEFGVAVDSNKITYVYDNYFTAKIDDTQEVFIFNPADETKTIRLSKYLKDNILLDASVSELEFYKFSDCTFVLTYKLSKNELSYFGCLAVSIDFAGEYNGSNIIEIYHKELQIVSDSLLLYDNIEISNLDFIFARGVLVESIFYNDNTRQYVAYSTNTEEDNVLFETDKFNEDDVLKVKISDNGAYINLKDSVEIYSFINYSEKHVYNKNESDDIQIFVTGNFLLIENLNKKVYLYNFESNQFKSVDFDVNYDINSIKQVNENYFCIFAKNEKNKMFYYDLNADLVITYDANNEKNEIIYSNGRKIVTEESIISSDNSLYAYILTDFNEGNIRLETQSCISENFVVNLGYYTICNINGEFLFNGCEFSSLKRVNEDKFIGYDLDKYYLLSLSEKTIEEIDIDSEFFNKLEVLFIDDEYYVMTNKNNVKSLSNLSDDCLKVSYNQQEIELNNITNYTISNIANVKNLCFINDSVNIYFNNIGKTVVTTSSAATNQSDVQTGNIYFDDPQQVANYNQCSASWNSSYTECTIYYDKGYYPKGTIKFKCVGNSQKDSEIILKVNFEQLIVTVESHKNFDSVPSADLKFNEVVKQYYIVVKNMCVKKGVLGELGGAGPFEYESGTKFEASTASTIYVKVSTYTAGSRFESGRKKYEELTDTTEGFEAGYQILYATDDSWVLSSSYKPTSISNAIHYYDYKITGAAIKGYTNIYGSKVDGLYNNKSLTGGNYNISDFSMDFIIDRKFATLYRYMVYAPHQYWIKFDYGEVPGTTTKINKTDHGLKKSEEYKDFEEDKILMSYTDSLDCKNESKYIPTTWFYKFTKWTISGSTYKDGDFTLTKNSTLSKLIQDVNSDGTPKTCTLTANWEPVNIKVSFRFMYADYDGMLDDAGNKSDLRITGKGNGLNGLNFKIGENNKYTSSSTDTEFVTRDNLSFPFSNSARLNNLRLPNSLGINNKTVYENYLNASIINSNYVIKPHSEWLVSKDIDEDGGEYYNFNSQETLGNVLIERSGVTNETTTPDHSIQIIVTYKLRNYNISLKDDSDNGYVDGGAIIGGSVIKDDSDVKTFDLTTVGASYQFIAQKSEIVKETIENAGDLDFFNTNYYYLETIYLRIEVPTVEGLDSKIERPYLLSQVKISKLGVYKNPEKSVGGAGTFTFDRAVGSTSWTVSFDGGVGYDYEDGDGYVYEDGRYNPIHNQVEGLDTGEYYNAIEILGSNDKYIYLKIYNVGLPVDGNGNLALANGTTGFVVEATAISNQQTMDSVSIKTDSGNGTGHVVQYAVMPTSDNKVWINNNYITWNSDNYIDNGDNDYMFVALSEYNSVQGITGVVNDKKYNGKQILANYGNTKLIVIRPNQSYYYSSPSPYLLSGGNGVGNDRPLNYALQSYVSQITIGDVTYHLKLNRDISTTGDGLGYSDYSLVIENGATAITGISDVEEIFTLNCFDVKNDRTGENGKFEFLGGYKLQPNSSGRIFEIYLVQCRQTHEILYFIYSDNLYAEGDSGSTWQSTMIQIAFNDFNNTLSVVVPNSTKSPGINGSKEFLYNGSTDSKVDETTVIYEYMYATAGTYGSSLGTGDSKSSNKSDSILKYDSSGLRSEDELGTGGYHSYYGFSDSTTTYLAHDRNFKINPNESVIFLFHPKDGYLISNIKVSIGNKQLNYSLLTDLDMEMDYAAGSEDDKYIFADGNGYSYSASYFVADTIKGTGLDNQKIGVFASQKFNNNWNTDEEMTLNSIYLLVSGISDNIQIEVSTTSYFELDFVDEAKKEGNGKFSGLFTGESVELTTQQLDVLNKLQILYCNDSNVWVKISSNDENTDDDPKYIKTQTIDGGATVYRVIFLENVNIFKNGIKLYLSGAEYSSYLTNMRSYASLNNDSTYNPSIHNIINNYLTNGTADITGRRYDDDSFYNNGSGFSYSASASNIKNLSGSLDKITSLYISDIRQLFEDLSQNSERDSNIFSSTQKYEYVQKYFLKFDVKHNIVDYKIGSYLSNNNIYQEYTQKDIPDSSFTTTTPVNSSNDAWSLSIYNDVSGRIKYIDDIGAYQLDFVAPGVGGNQPILKRDSWFNDVMLSSIKEQKTTIKLNDSAYHSTSDVPSGYYYNYINNPAYKKYWQDYTSIAGMSLSADGYGLYGYGVNYEYINIPGYKLQYLELETVDYGNIFINIDAIYNNTSWDRSVPYVVHLDKGKGKDNYYLAVSITGISNGYNIRLYDLAALNNEYSLNNNYGDHKEGRTSIELISNNIGVNFYLNAYEYDIKYDANIQKGKAENKISPEATDIKIIEGESRILDISGADINQISQKVYYDCLTVLDYQLYMPGYTFVGWGSENYYDSGNAVNRYDVVSNTWNSSSVWLNPYKDFYYNSTSATPWENISITDIPYDFYIKNNSLNGYFITDTGISGKIVSEYAGYLKSIESYNFWYAYSSKFTEQYIQKEADKKVIKLYAIWKASVYSLIFDTNDANIRGLETSDEEKTNEEYLKDLDSIRNGSTAAMLNVVTSNFTGDEVTPLSLDTYKFDYVQKTEFFDDSFTSDGRGYNVFIKDANDVPSGNSHETYYCYVAFDSDLWYITKENTATPDTYFSYFESATAGSGTASIKNQLIFPEKNDNGNLLNLVIDRYGYTWLGWFKTKNENTENLNDSKTLGNNAVLKSTYVNSLINSGNDSQGAMPKLDYTLFSQFEDKFDFDISEVEDEESVGDIDKPKFTYFGEHKIYTDPTEYLNYTTVEDGDLYVCFYRYYIGSTIKITCGFSDGESEQSFNITIDYLNKVSNENKTLYLYDKINNVDVGKAVFTYFDTSVSYSCYNIAKNNSFANDNYKYQIILNREYSQILVVTGSGETKNISLKRNKCNFKYIKLYANWETNQYSVILDKQDCNVSSSNPDNPTLSNKYTSTAAESQSITIPDATWYFDDIELSYMLNNFNPERVGYDFVGWSYYYYDIDTSLLDVDTTLLTDPEDVYRVNLNKYYYSKNIINKPAVYLTSTETAIESTMYLNSSLINKYEDYIALSDGIAVHEAAVVLEAEEGGNELTEEEQENQEIISSGLKKTSIVPLYSYNDAIKIYASGSKEYVFRDTYNTVASDEPLYQEQLGDSEYDDENTRTGKGHYVYLFAIWRAQTFVINTSLNIERQQLENLYDEDSRFAVAFYDAVSNQPEEEPEASPTEDEESETHSISELYPDYNKFIGINSNNYKLVYDLEEHFVYDKIDSVTGKPMDPPTGEILNNPVKKIQFTDIVATVYFTITFDESLLDAYFNIPNINGNNVKYYLKDLFAVSSGYYFLGWVTNCDNTEDNYIVKNTLKTLFNNLDNYTDNVSLRPQGEETEEDAYLRLQSEIDNYYSRYVFGGDVLSNDRNALNDDQLNNSIFNKDYYEKVFVTNYKHHFDTDETYLSGNYNKLSDVNKYNASTNFGYVKIAATDKTPETKCYIQIDELLSSQDNIGLISTDKKLYFRYNGWKYYIYYIANIDGNQIVLQNDFENLYYVDSAKTKYIIRFDSEGYAYALVQQTNNPADYNHRYVFDHTNGGYRTTYTEENNPIPVNLTIAVFFEKHNTVEIDNNGSFKNLANLTNLVAFNGDNRYTISNLLLEDGSETRNSTLEFVPCQTRQFTVFANWQNKNDLVMNIINSSNIKPTEENEELEEEVEEEEVPEEEVEEEEVLEEEEVGPGYETSPSYNPGLAGYYEIHDNSTHIMFDENQSKYSYKQEYISAGTLDEDGIVKVKTDNELDEKISFNYNYYDSIDLNILPYYNGRYLSTMKFTYYGTEENERSTSNITNTFRNMKYTLVFKFRWNDVRRMIELVSLTYTKSTAAMAQYYGTSANYQSLVLYKNYDENDIKTNYYVLKDLGVKNDNFSEFKTFDSLGLLNNNNFTEKLEDGSMITEEEQYYMMRIYEYFEYDATKLYDDSCKAIGYIPYGKEPQEGYDNYIIQDINKVAMNFPNIKTSVDIECQFSVQTFGVNFYNILDEEGNTITLQSGKTNVYDTNFENEEEFKQAYENNESFISFENASKTNLPTIPQDCSYVDELTNDGIAIEYNVPYGFFVYGMYFKSKFKPHRPIDTNSESEAKGLPNNTVFLENERYGFNYIYSDGNYNIGSTSRLFKFVPTDEYDIDTHQYQCSPVLGSTSSFNEAVGIRLDGLSFYMFGGWFESQVNEDTGRVEFVLYNELSEATYINRHIDFYGYYYMVNTPTSITYYTWKEETQKYETYTANKDQYALNANIENKQFNKQSDILIKAEGFTSYADSQGNAKIFTYKKYGVDGTTFANDNITSKDFHQSNASDVSILYNLLTTYWYYEDSYLVLKLKDTNQYVKYDESNDIFTLSGYEIEIRTTNMIEFTTSGGFELELVKMYSEDVLSHKDDNGTYEKIENAISGATLYYKYNGNYYPFKKLPSSSNYRYSLDINGDNVIDYYFLYKDNEAGGHSGYIYDLSGRSKDAGDSLEVIYDYYIIYDKKYYKIQYGLNPLAQASATNRQNLVNIPLNDSSGTIAKCYFDYRSKRLYDMNTNKEVRFLYDVYSAVNDNYAINATYSGSEWGISGIKVKSLPSPNMTYWYNDEKYGLVGYIKLTDNIFEGMKRADAVGNGSADVVPADAEEEEDDDVPSGVIDVAIEEGLIYKSFMENIKILYKDIWDEDSPNYDARFKHELKIMLGDYIGSYTKEKMLESFLIADEFHMNSENNAIEYITVNIPIKFSGEIPTSVEHVTKKVDLSIIIKYQFDIISTKTLVEENIYAIPIYSPYLMSFDTNDPCVTLNGNIVNVDVDKMDLWHFELTSKNTHVYNEENGDKLKIVILSDSEMKYLKQNMVNDIPTMLSIMFNNYNKYINGTLPYGEKYINPNVGGGRVFEETFVVVQNPNYTQYKKWSISVNFNTFIDDIYYAIAFYEKTVNENILGTGFNNYVVRVSDNIIKIPYWGTVDDLEIITIKDIAV